MAGLKRYAIGQFSIQLVLLTGLCILQACGGVANESALVKTSASCSQAGGTERQLRAAWIATVTNIDWPSRPGLPIDTQKQEFMHQLDALQQMHMNAAVVQIKPEADAFYPSQYGPWSQYLTGTQGKNPGYNPLAFMIEESHRRSLEFHAWFNPFRVSLHDDIQQLAPNHPARQHPDWVVSYGGKLYYNPGLPEVRTFVINSILEVVKNYDIDAVHLDDYFYPYRVAGQDFPDDAAYQKYGVAHFPHKDDWRRDNINHFMQDLAHSIKQAKSYVKLGVSPFGVWRNKSSDPTGSDTTAGQTDYDDLYADTRTWIRQSWLDYIAPQIYWNFGYPPAAYEKLVQWWSQEVKNSKVQLYIGQAAYKITNWTDSNELPKQLQYNLTVHAVQGSIFFSLKDLLTNPRGIRDRLSNDIYRQPALIPVMPWLTGKAPHAIEHLSSQQAGSAIALHWQDAASSNTTYYAIYRVEGTGTPCPQAANLLGTVRKTANNAQEFSDPTAVKGKMYTYYVTALDRLHNESTPGPGITTTVR